MSNRWPHILFDKRRANTIMVSMSPEFGSNNYAEIFGEIISGQVHFFEIIITQTEYTFKIDGKNITNNNMGPGKDYESGYVPITQRIAPILWGSPQFGVINGLKVWELQIESIPPYVSSSPTISPTNIPSKTPTQTPTKAPVSSTATNEPTITPTTTPTTTPTSTPTNNPVISSLTNITSTSPTNTPTNSPTNMPTNYPTNNPTTNGQININPSKSRTKTVLIIMLISLLSLCFIVGLILYLLYKKFSKISQNFESSIAKENVNNAIVPAVSPPSNLTTNTAMIFGEDEPDINENNNNNNNNSMATDAIIDGEQATMGGDDDAIIVNMYEIEMQQKHRNVPQIINHASNTFLNGLKNVQAVNEAVKDDVIDEMNADMNADMNDTYQTPF